MSRRFLRCAFEALCTALLAGGTLGVIALAFADGGTAGIWLCCAVSSVIAAVLSRVQRTRGAMLPVSVVFFAVACIPLFFAIRGRVNDGTAISALTIAILGFPAAVWTHAFLTRGVMSYLPGVLSVTACMLCFAFSSEVPLLAACPCAAGCAMALALARTGNETAHYAAAAASVAVLLAMLLIPGENAVYKPLATAAEKLQELFSDYFRFVEQRYAFSINAAGYDHVEMKDGKITAMLGGPVEPDRDTALIVETDSDVLLRGTIKTEYTGYSWVDTQARARGLYYNMLRAGYRDNIMDAGRSPSGAFRPVNVKVTVADDDATSTLFVPGRLEEFEMDYSNAVYYNNLGEVFLTQNAEKGIFYTLTASEPIYGEELRDLVIAGGEVSLSDEDRAMYLALPDGIERDVMFLTLDVTGGCGNDYDRAMAIRSWLSSHCAYTLTPPWPEAGRDFVSQFVLDTRQGYCSYFASAMTVMCRQAGIPARYIEGYFVLSSDGPAEVTGRNAHAWVEVWFDGVGWVSFDPTYAAFANERGADENGDNVPGHEDEGPDQPENTPEPEGPDETEEPDATPPPEDPEPTPTPGPDDTGDTPPDEPEDDDGDDDGGDDDGGDDDNDDGGDDEPDGPEPQAPAGDDTTDGGGDGDGPRLWWLWLLIALAVAAAAWFAYRRVRATDVALLMTGKDPRRDMYTAYRACLTVLREKGLAILPGEDAAAFARRAVSSGVKEDFLYFSQRINDISYSPAAPSRADARLGLTAYRAIRASLSRRERLRHVLHLTLHGIGDTKRIP